MNPEDMSGGTGHPGAVEQVPEAWIGQYVWVMLNGASGNENKSGRLEAVGAYGITLQPADHKKHVRELPPKLFLPWNSVLWLRLEKD